MKISILFLLFIIYSIIGWIVEVIYTAVLEKKIINRGFLMGPYCPIYGVGCILMIILLDKYKSDLVILFIMSMLLCALLEYLTGYLLERIFKARWWDYSEKRFNINGRVCLETLIPFGIFGCAIVKVINPIFVNILVLFPKMVILSISVLISIIFIMDVVVSSCVIAKIKVTTENIVSDSTEEITKLVREYVSKNSKCGKRLLNSFPELEIKKYAKNKKK